MKETLDAIGRIGASLVVLLAVTACLETRYNGIIFPLPDLTGAYLLTETGLTKQDPSSSIVAFPDQKGMVVLDEEGRDPDDGHNGWAWGWHRLVVEESPGVCQWAEGTYEMRATNPFGGDFVVASPTPPEGTFWHDWHQVEWVSLNDVRLALRADTVVTSDGDTFSLDSGWRRQQIVFPEGHRFGCGVFPRIGRAKPDTSRRTRSARR